MCHTTVCDAYSVCCIVSVTIKSEYELASDAVLGTDLHFSKEY